MIFLLSPTSLAAIRAHACEAYPDECCGLIVERDGREGVVRVTNIQNELHAQDPGQFPRTAAIAYTMGPEAAPILMGAERGALRRTDITGTKPSPGDCGSGAPEIRMPTQVVRDKDRYFFAGRGGAVEARWNGSNFDYVRRIGGLYLEDMVSADGGLAGEIGRAHV
jgi:hypothetical protein